MRRELAELLTRDLLACSGKLDQSVADVGTTDQNFFQRYRMSVGQVMGLLYIEILRDVFRQYPDLEPDSNAVGNRTTTMSQKRAVQLARESYEMLSSLRPKIQNGPTNEEIENIIDAIESATILTQGLIDTLVANYEESDD